MADDQWTRAKQILDALLDADPEDPAAWLDEHGPDEPALRREVESLFRAFEEGTLSTGDQAADWMDEEAVPPDPADLQGRQIGPYRLIEEIGVGGMSVVYRAKRTGEDFEQTVAIKLLQRRLHSGDAEQRFRAERQVLASLDHPHIAQLHDGGVTEGGRPYLVMEHVDGTPLTDYADANNLSLQERLGLLDQVLEAVQTAHRQLVVHRDLKPSNVLVTETESGPVVKLLDFGIAKLLDDSMPVTAPQTETGHHLMTHSYAAPEQVLGDDVTTRTDVYQLGVLAYELLAGTRPFDLSGKSLTEVERIVLEEEPSPPSEQAERNAGRLQGDLDTILQKALRKEPERRYRSVEALAMDLERHRAGEPIEARPATIRYRAKKFVRRNRWGVGVAAAFLAVIAVAGTMLVRQRNRAQRNAQRAQQQKRTAEAVSSFMRGLIGVPPSESYAASGISSNQAIFANEPWASDFRTEIRKNLSRLDEQTENPQARAAVLHSVAQMVKDNNKPVWADSLFRRSLALRRATLGPAHPRTVETLGSLARLKFRNGTSDSARVYLRRYLRLQKKVGVRTHRDSVHYVVSNWHYALTLKDSVRRARRFHSALERVDDVFGPQSKQRALALLTYADVADGPAIDRYEEAFPLLQSHFDSLNTTLIYAHYTFGDQLFLAGKSERGLRHLRTAIRRFKQKGATSWYGYARIVYASHLKELGRTKQAYSVLQDIYAWQQEHLPPLHKDRAYLHQVLAHLEFEQGRYENAEKHLRRALAIGTKINDPMIKPHRNYRYVLARSLLKQGDVAEAVDLLQTNANFSGRAREWVRKSRRLLDDLTQTTAGPRPRDSGTSPATSTSR